MRKTVRGSFLGMGGATTSIEVDQQPQTDPAAERAERLRENARRILADNAERQRQYEAKLAAARTNAIRQRIDSVKKACRTAEEWSRVTALVNDPRMEYTTEQVMSGAAHEMALRGLRGE